MARLAPDGSFHKKSGGSRAGVEPPFTPISKNVTPCFAKGGMMPRVWPGTSVILAPVVTLPKRRSSDCASARLPSIIDGLNISVCHVNGNACQAMSPRAIASSIVLRSAAEA